MNLPYREGTWFAVPLRKGGFAVGLVARATRKGGVILCYFFGPNRASPPTLAEVEHLRSSEAVRVARVGDLSLLQGDWPVIGHSTLWKRCDWPMPAFVRREEFSGRAWRVHYSDADPNQVVGEEPEPSDSTTLEQDVMFGAGAAEIELTELVSPPSGQPFSSRGRGSRSGREDRPRTTRGVSDSLRRAPKALWNRRLRRADFSDEGREQAVLVHLRGTGPPEHVYQERDLATLEDKLVEAIEPGALGEFDGNEVGIGGATLFMYGPDAERLFAGIEPVLRSYPLSRGAKVVIRYGGPGATQREVQL